MKRTLLLILFLFICTFTYAQETITVTGVVTDGTNQPMPGATVMERTTSNAVITANNGSYQIKVKSNAILVFSYLGSKTVEVQVKDRKTINVKLLDDQNNLNEVVITGYGQAVQRKDLTGAVSSISGTELAKVPVQNVAQALQGRIAGMQVTMADGTPGAAPSMKIRGGTSITQSNEPLYVVDGVPQTDGLDFLDPMDIESVDVLKDASSTAIYGARGANGVVLITTKQIKGGGLKVNYDGYVGAKKITTYLPVLNAYDYAFLLYERAIGRGGDRLPAFEANYGTFADLEKNYGNRPGIDWQKEVFGHTVMNQYHKFSISGGGNDTRFNIFYSKNIDEGIMLGSGSDKNIAKLTVSHNLSKKFSINAIVNYSNQKLTGIGTQEGGTSRFNYLQNLFQYRPTNGIKGLDDELIDLDLDPLDPNQSSPSFQSPLVAIESNPRDRKKKTLNVNASLQYNIIKNLTYRGLVSYTDGSDKAKSFTTTENLAARRTGGPFGSISDALANRFNYNNTLTYSNTFNKIHKLDATIGQEYIYNYTERFGVSTSAFPNVNLGWDKLELGTLPGIPTSFAEDDKLFSLFGRLNYSYKGKYLLTSSLRYDGSSKFGEENIWGIFPSAAVAWRIVEEDFMKKFKAISDLKLRLSYGSSGNNRIGNYQALGIFGTSSYPLNNQLVTSAGQLNLPNPSLKWEANQSFNLGLDLGLFKQRVSFTAELYDNRSKDLLYRSRIPASSGFTEQFRNIGTTSSRGIEFTLNTINVRNNSFNWSSNFNIAFNKTKVLGLSEGENSMLTNSWTTTNDYILQVGQPVGIMYGYKQAGLYQVDDFDFNAANNTYTLKSGVVTDVAVVQPGYIKFADLNNDGKIDDNDRTAIGNANAKFSGGLNNTFSYKGFDLSVFVDFTYGNDIYNANKLNNSALFNDYASTFAYFKDRWKIVNAAGQRILDPVELANANSGKTIPVFDGATAKRLHDTMIEDGSFLRINNISLGYTLPKSWLSKVKIANARLYVTAYNLHVFTNYSGYDPEVSVFSDPLTPGVDFSAYPRAKSFVAGLNVSF
ncbi:SusC/RagA family TonB-linked outer membrane protein [Pedobacter heparinus]|uniref:TonB-dependent receptor plug n=1 Tax=Pedobacter heparinus (strain ATCC 13125 / DSM 2366 / CIP 104194 / JCM 7457 / NBRC 12017 / NCIMB 9290 / NRRL B-14731 / HIM 762-3) TaxID=485917 RepID=C6Y1Q1_PEDHD|nr:TonB-dependent receptor [Pedobacter heparinus]ACU05043.1 TonB-dependent receptor plug [Pedobacter heparinus DSM 2366]